MRRLEGHLRSIHVETRRWYEGGLHLQPHFRRYGRDPLPVTESLSQRLLGLPAAHDLTKGEVAPVVDGLAEAAEVARAGSP
jgi:dTDP-4-amino-4,6-dideoxygalactose transaminase